MQSIIFKLTIRSSAPYFSQPCKNKHQHMVTVWSCSRRGCGRSLRQRSATRTNASMNWRTQVHATCTQWRVFGITPTNPHRTTSVHCDGLPRLLGVSDATSWWGVEDRNCNPPLSSPSAFLPASVSVGVWSAFIPFAGNAGGEGGRRCD
jgi:hypothetical protein